jgi:hypothetical protein
VSVEEPKAATCDTEAGERTPAPASHDGLDCSMSTERNWDIQIIPIALDKQMAAVTEQESGDSGRAAAHASEDKTRAELRGADASCPTMAVPKVPQGEGPGVDTALQYGGVATGSPDTAEAARDVSTFEERDGSAEEVAEGDRAATGVAAVTGVTWAPFDVAEGAVREAANAQTGPELSLAHQVAGDATAAAGEVGAQCAVAFVAGPQATKSGHQGFTAHVQDAADTGALQSLVAQSLDVPESAVDLSMHGGVRGDNHDLAGLGAAEGQTAEVLADVNPSALEAARTQAQPLDTFSLSQHLEVKVRHATHVVYGVCPRGGK